MNRKLRVIQQSAAHDWADQFRAYEDTCIILQWLDERDFDVPESFKFHLGNTYDCVFLTYITGKEIDLYKMNEMIQHTLRVVPTFDIDYDHHKFRCPVITIPDSRLPLRLTFGFEPSLLDALLGDFCIITRRQVPHSYSVEETEVKCFA